MNKFLKFGGLGCLGLIVLGIIGSALSGGSNTNSTNSNTSNGQAQNNNQQQEEIVAGLNETVQSGDLAFTVLDIEESKSLGNSYLNRTAQGTFYTVTIKIENKGTKTATFDSSMAKVIDDQGREFERSIDGQTAKGLTQGHVDLFLQQVQPGLSVTGDLVFDLPEASDAFILLKGGLFAPNVKVKII